MMPSLRAEFRKILTVRTTYASILITFLLAVALVGFWIYGFKDVSHAGANPNVVTEMIYGATGLVSTFMGIFIAILMVGHEYRHNLILYSLTSINRRSKVFFNKYFAVLSFSLVVTAVITALACLAFYFGQHVHHTTVVAQTMPGWPVIWHSLLAAVGGVTFGFVIAALVRSFIASIAIFLLLPSTVEPLLQLLLKDNVRYLPFTALGNLTALKTVVPYTTSAWVVTGYMVVLGLAAWIMFVKRDAN